METNLNNVFIFTHYYYANIGEYRNYVYANNMKSACIKLFKYWNCRNHFYEIVSIIANYFSLTYDEIGYNKITDFDNENIIDIQLENIIKNLVLKYVPDDETMFEIIKWHTDINKPNLKIIKSLEHHIIRMECNQLSEILIV